jgi:hypothetical protein
VGDSVYRVRQHIADQLRGLANKLGLRNWNRCRDRRDLPGDSSYHHGCLLKKPKDSSVKASSSSSKSSESQEHTKDSSNAAEPMRRVRAPGAALSKRPQIAEQSVVLAGDRRRDFSPIRGQHFTACFVSAPASDSIGLAAKIGDERLRLNVDPEADRGRPFVM